MKHIKKLNFAFVVKTNQLTLVDTTENFVGLKWEFVFYI